MSTPNVDDTSGPILTLDGLGRDFVVHAGGGRQVLRAVDEVSLTLIRGTTTSIVGESGSGKTTLARLVAGIDTPTRGRILLAGQDITHLRGRSRSRARRRVQMVFQDPHDSLDPRQRLGSIITEPLRAAGWSRGDARTRALEVLREVGLPESALQRWPHEFSGGQRQRIGIARAIGPGPAVAVLDEPTSALDVSVQAAILGLLRRIQREQSLTYVSISHNLAVVRHLSDQVAVMYLGKIMEAGPAAAVFSAPHHPYTKALLSAVPSVEPGARRERIVLSGDLPSPLVRHAGCVFASRCPYVQPTRCRDEIPAPRPLRSGQSVACHWAESIEAGALAPAARAVMPAATAL